MYRFISNYQNRLGPPTGAMAWIVVADVWKTVPFMTIILMAALHLFDAETQQAILG